MGCAQIPGRTPHERRQVVKSDMDLLIKRMEDDQMRSLRIAKDIKELAQEIGETKAIAMSLHKGLTVGDRDGLVLRVKSCDDRYPHHGHLWWERENEPGDHAYRCDGRGQDAT